MGVTLAYRRPAEQTDEPITLERLRAYYVALSLNPEVAHAAPVVRALAIDRIIAGLRAAERFEDETDARGRDQCIALIRHDEAARAERVRNGGW
jgi:hypothetical protein